jgi:hypothetical protein
VRLRREGSSRVRSLRWATLAGACVAMLSLAPPGSAAFQPRLTATGATGGAVTLGYSQSALDDGPALVALYAPASHTARFETGAGAVVGSATARAVGGDFGGSTVRLDGAIRVAAASTPLQGGAAATVGEAARTCTGSDASVALWVATLQGFGQTLQLAFAVQRVTSGPLAGTVAIFTCPPPADVPKTTAGRSPLGLELVTLTLRLTNSFAVPAGVHAWHLRAAPYSPGTGGTNAAAAVEAEAWYGSTQSLTLAAKPVPRSSRVRVSGKLLLGGKGVAGQKVRILAGGKQLALATTTRTGAFAATVTVASARASLVAKAAVPASYTACSERAFAPLPCTTSIRSGFRATSAAVLVRR